MKIIVQNIATEYEDQGTGDVLLFLHGWQDTLHSFDALVPLLSSSHRVIRLDLPGFGKSEMPKETWDLDAYVHFVQNFIQKLNISVDVLVGHSFGGRVIIKGESTNSFHTRKIVLIGSAGIAKHRTLRNRMIKFFAKVGGLISFLPPFIFWRARMRQKLYQSIGSDYLKTGGLKETFLKTISEDLRAAATKVIAPTLLVWGENDTETPLHDGKLLSQLIPHATLHVINGAGHFVHKDKPQEVAAFIQEFIA